MTRPKAKEVPNCRTCGACCVAPYWGTEFVDLSPEDVDRLSKYYQRRVNGQGAFGVLGLVPVCLPIEITGTETRCSALRGTVMKRVCCAIYKRRPRGCRAFKPGSGCCLDIRRIREDEYRTHEV